MRRLIDNANYNNEMNDNYLNIRKSTAPLGVAGTVLTPTNKPLLVRSTFKAKIREEEEA
jgi:hypothetical protein